MSNEVKGEERSMAVSFTEYWKAVVGICFVYMKLTGNNDG